MMVMKVFIWTPSCLFIILQNSIVDSADTTAKSAPKVNGLYKIDATIIATKAMPVMVRRMKLFTV